MTSFKLIRYSATDFTFNNFDSSESPVKSVDIFCQ